jgi:transposase
VAADDHPVVLKMRPERHRDLARLRCQAACRLHATLCELIPGGVSKKITTPRATALLASVAPDRTVAAARHDLALAQLADLRRIDDQLRQRLAPACLGCRARWRRG